MKRVLFSIILILVVLSTMDSTAECSAITDNKEAVSERQKVQSLETGDCIGIAAPASSSAADCAEAIDYLHQLGYTTKLMMSVRAADGYLAGSDELRAADINELFRDDTVKAILCLRGGYGSARLLDRLNYAEIASHPKLMIGYSDITALHTVLGERCNMVTVHGPMLVNFRNKKSTSEYTRQQFENGLKDSGMAGRVKLPEKKAMATVVPGKAEGIIVGGNLSIICSLVGTPYELKGDGSILFLEEVDEKPYRVDRMLLQLWQNGLLKRVNGIVLGDFTKCNARADGVTVEQVIEHYAKLTGKPVIKGLPAGHDRDNMFLPFGVRVKIQGDKNGSASLLIKESLYK